MKSANSDSTGARNFRTARPPLRKTRFEHSVLFHVKRNILHSTQIIHFLLHDHTTPRCENKNLGFLAAFCNCGLLSSPSAKRKGTAPQLICCDSGPRFAPLRPVAIRNRKKVAVRAIFFVFRPLGQPQDGAIGEKPQEWQLGITLYSTRNRAVRTQRIFICAVLIAGDTLNQKGWTIHRPAF